MPASPQPQQTSPTSPDGRVPVKLRSACDSCSVAKVKCDKAHPICNRCKASRFTCSYSPSRRQGKQWTKRLAEQQLQTPSSGLSSPSLPNMALAPSLPVLSSHTPALLTPATSGTASPIHQLDLEPESVSSFDYFAMDGTNSLSTGFHFGTQWDGMGFSHISDLSEDLGIGVRIDDLDRNPASFEPVRPTVHDCEGRAFSTLQSLHHFGVLHNSSAETTSSSRLASMDRVLQFNKMAMGVLKELLECEYSCAQQPHLTLLYMTIVSKALFWYRLAVSTQTPSSHGLDTHADSSSHNGPSGKAIPPIHTNTVVSERGVTPTSIKMGIFDLEEQDQRILTRAVLLREVRKLEEIVDHMSAMGKGEEDVGDGEETQGPNLYGLAVVRLKAELRDTVKLIKRFGTARGDTGTLES